MNSNAVPEPGEFTPKLQTKITPIVTLPAVAEPRPALWQRSLELLARHPKLAVLLTGLAVATLSLTTWLCVLLLENKVLKTQLAQQAAMQENAENAEALKARITEAKEQMLQLKTQMEQQQTEQVLDSREDLLAENARLLQELNQLSKPQLGAPLVSLAPANSQPAQTETGQPGGAPKKTLITSIDVPYHLALFTVILQQPQDKIYPSYFVELTDSKGKNVAWSEQLKQVSGATIPLTFAKRSHAPNKYRLKLYGMNGKKKEFLDHYDMQLNYQPEPTPKKTGRQK